MNTTRDKMASRIREIAALPDGWLDGRGTSVPKVTIDRAMEVAEYLTKEGLRSAIFPSNRTVPSSVLFEVYENGENTYDIEVNPDGLIEFDGFMVEFTPEPTDDIDSVMKAYREIAGTQ